MLGLEEVYPCSLAGCERYLSQTVLSSDVGAYRPVIIFHGILSDAKNMNDLKGFIQDAGPGTQVYNIDGFDDLDSMTQMWKQVESIRAKMVPIMTNVTDGVHLICFSQGVL